MKQKLLTVIAMLAVAVLCFPVPQYLKDGGTVKYQAILYSVQDVHRLHDEPNAAEEFIEGTIVEVLGVEIFNNVDNDR